MSTKWLTTKTVRERYGGVSEMTLIRWTKSRGFPPPKKIAGRNYRLESELDAWDRANAVTYTRPRPGEQVAKREAAHT